MENAPKNLTHHSLWQNFQSRLKMKFHYYPFSAYLLRLYSLYVSVQKQADKTESFTIVPVLYMWAFWLN